jgi:hypothetical protein
MPAVARDRIQRLSGLLAHWGLRGGGRDVAWRAGRDIGQQGQQGLGIRRLRGSASAT